MVRETFFTFATLFVAGVLAGPTRIDPATDIDGPNEVIFTLYTQGNPTEAEKITPDDDSESPSFNPDNPTRVVIHGAFSTEESIIPFRDAYIATGQEYNIILVDWRRPASEEEDIAKNLAILVGDYIGEVLNYLIDNRRLDPDTLTIIGLSMGGQIAGIVGNRLEGRAAQVVGLDPASEIFDNNPLENQIDPTDAKFVQVIHTNGGDWGFLDSRGHADFYPNGGTYQVGCPNHGHNDLCDHAIVRDYYIESIASKNFVGIRCSRYDEFIKGNCNSNEKAVMGEWASHTISGDYYLETAAESPYGKGFSSFDIDGPNEVTLNLYTQGNPTVAEKITLDDDSTSPSFNTDNPTRVVIHGGNSAEQSIISFRDAYISTGDEYNIILVDWSRPASEEEDISKHLAILVGDYIGEVLNHLIDNRGLDPDTLTIIGHSMGGQIAGIVGNRLGGRAAEVVGLDPASEIFDNNPLENQIDPTDAKFVQVIHTNGGDWGFLDSRGDADFYPSGGTYQAGCPNHGHNQLCDHIIVAAYYIESIVSKNFVAVRCSSYEEFIKGNCNNNEKAVMGEWASHTISGDYYLETAAESPYGKGFYSFDIDAPNEVTFNLYTQGNPTVAEKITLDDDSTSPSFNPANPTRVVIHGGNSAEQTIISFRDAYISTGDEYNIILVDWSRPASAGEDISKNLAILVGDYIGEVLNHLIDDRGLDPDTLTIIGHSMGGQIAGIVGNRLGGRVAEVVGLDPASEVFDNNPLENQIDPTDAKFVQVIHTNGGDWGFLDSRGHADFYPNGGTYQDGCPNHGHNELCDHIIVLDYYTESITSKDFVAVRCTKFDEFIKGNCYSNEKAVMGEWASHTISGDFYLEAASESPYGKGFSYFDIDAPNEVTFNLYTQGNPTVAEIITLDDDSTSPSFNPANPTRVVIHGAGLSEEKIIPFRDAYIATGDEYNIILVDWSRPASEKEDIHKHLAILVGDYIGEVLNHLIDNRGLDPDTLTIIGHSMGGQIAGVVGNRLGGLAAEVVGLDPASEVFDKNPLENQLDATDAKFVQVIHTNGGGMGFLDSRGDADFYPNGGTYQVACVGPRKGCDHGIVTEYYVESINSKDYVATLCSRYDEFIKGNCNDNDKAVMGEWAAHTISGDYYLETSAESPYGIGSPNSSSSISLNLGLLLFASIFLYLRNLPLPNF